MLLIVEACYVVHAALGLLKAVKRYYGGRRNGGLRGKEMEGGMEEEQNKIGRPRYFLISNLSLVCSPFGHVMVKHCSLTLLLL